MKQKTKKRVQGVISVMLSLLMLPFISVAGVVVESVRYYNANSLLTEAMSGASYSTLASYDQYLLDRFGLLAMDQETPVSTTYKKYLEKNLNLISENGLSNLVTDAQGIYPLTDPDILYYQICEMDKLLSPVQLTIDGLNIQDLIKELERSLHVLNFFNGLGAVGDLLGSKADLMTDVETLRDICKQLEELKGTSYPNALSAFKTAAGEYGPKAEAYADAKATADTAQQEKDEAVQKQETAEDPGAEKQNVKDAEAALEEANTALDTAKTEFDTAKAALTTARDAYASVLETYASTLQSYTDAIVSYKEHKKKMTESLATAGGALLDGQAELKEVEQEAYEELHSVSKKFAEEEAEREFRRFWGKQSIDTIKNGLDSTHETMKNHLDADMGPFILAMNEMAQKVRAISLELDADGKAPTITVSDYEVTLPDTMASDNLEEELKKQESDLRDSGVLDTLKHLADIFNGIFKLQVFVDYNLNAIVDTNYYSTNCSGLSSLNMAPSPVNQEDKKLAEYYKKEIDQGSGGISTLTQSGGTTVTRLQALTEEISGVMSNVSKLGEWNGLVGTLRLMADIVRGSAAVFGKLIGIMAPASSILEQFSYERLMFNQYLVGMLPNRINYDSGTAMNGYSYSKIPLSMTGSAPNLLPPLSMNSMLNAYNSLPKQGPETMFCGAELEYLFCGSPREYDNQMTVFLMLMIERLVINLPAFLMDEDAQELLATGIPGIIYFVCVVLLEPFMDTIFLVNGESVSVVKDDLYLSPTGIPKLLKRLAKISVSGISDVIKKSEELQSATERVDAYNREHGTSMDMVPADTKPTKNTYLKNLKELDYEQHLLILMMLFGNDKQQCRYLADLIQMEAESMRVEKHTATHFDLSRSYTFIRSEATGAVNQLLPIPMLANNQRLGAKVLLYRGY